MRISVKTANKKIPFVVHFPLWLIKTKIGAKMMLQNNGNKEPTEEEILEARATFKSMYKDLRKFIKTNGHFALVEARDAEGDTVKVSL